MGALLLAPACAPNLPAFRVAEQDVPPASAHPASGMASDQQIKRLESYLTFLTGDFCQGRTVGTTGAVRSAQYVIDEFKTMGLAPAFKDEYVQPYYVPGMCDNSAALEVLDGTGNATQVFSHLKDFVEIYAPKWGVTTVKAPLTMAPSSDGAAGWIGTNPGTVILAKSTITDMGPVLDPAAQSRCGAVLVCTPASVGPFAQRFAMTPMAGSPLVFAITPACYDLLTKSVGQAVRVALDAKQVKTPGFNVAGILGDPTKSMAAVVLAHRDAIARTGKGESPGGTDNASGTAALLEISRSLKADPAFDGAAVFLSTDGEEVGLTGAKEFVSRLPIKKDRIAFVINMDCIGVRGSETVVLYATAGDGTAAHVRDLVSLGLKESGYIVEQPNENYPSDHLAFEAQGYGVISVHSPRTDMDPHIHSIADTAETVDPEALAAVVKAITGAIVKALKAR